MTQPTTTYDESVTEPTDKPVGPTDYVAIPSQYGTMYIDPFRVSGFWHYGGATGVESRLALIGMLEPVNCDLSVEELRQRLQAARQRLRMVNAFLEGKRL